MGPRFSADMFETERRIAEELVERELSAIGARTSGVHVERHLVEGPPARMLLDAAEDAELLVLGASRHGSLGGVVLGAVGQKCLEHALCPLVIVRTGEHPKP